MNNKEITMYELVGLIQKGKAPIRIKYDDKIWIYSGRDNDYYSEGIDGDLELFDDYLKQCLFMFLNDTVEILEENKWEDIEELDTEYSYSYESINITLNKIIKNLKVPKRKAR